jgi:hypothetical protein
VPRDDDDACRATVERINQSRPQWLVLWGLYSRLYWAFPLFAARHRFLVHAAYPDALIARMDEAERRFRIDSEQLAAARELPAVPLPPPNGGVPVTHPDDDDLGLPS